MIIVIRLRPPIPREYTILPVDEISNIYHQYNDSYYDELINETKKIFRYYKDGKKCNPNITYDPNDGKTC